MKHWFRVVLLAAVLAGCGGEDKGPWDVRGVVIDLRAEEGQILIEHEPIEGFMPAMTMNFDVPDRTLLDGVAPGQAVEFELHYDGKRYSITALQVVAEGEAGSSGLTLGSAPALMPAPDFTLVDQEGQTVSLSDWSGKVVVLDFIFTHCPGPCPVLTGLLRDAQQLLPPAARERTQFVSITLDPERDTPEVLKRYAGHRGIDTTDWSLLTGSDQGIEIVLHRYGVATERDEETQNIDHLVATFLIDPRGQIVKRYLGTQFTPEEIVKDVERLLS